MSILDSEIIGIAAACFIGMVASLILAAWREMLHRGELLALREYIEDLSHNAGMDYSEVMRCAMGYINNLLGE